MKIFDIFFSVNFWLVTKLYKNKDYPIFSTIIGVSTYQFFTLLFIFDFYQFQILDNKNLIIGESKTPGFIVMTIILFLNYYFYSRKKQYIDVLKKFNKLSQTNKKLSFVVSILYMIMIIALTVYSVYSIRNNIKWF